MWAIEFSDHQEARANKEYVIEKVRREMRHKVIIMYGKDEVAGGGAPHSQDGAPMPQEERESTLDAAAAMVSSVAPRFFKLIKARMNREFGMPDDLRELGESQMWVLHSLTKGRHQNSELARRYNVTDPTMSRIIDGLVRKGYV